MFFRINCSKHFYVINTKNTPPNSDKKSTKSVLHPPLLGNNTPNNIILKGPDSDKISCGIHFFKVLVQIHYPLLPKAIHQS